MTRIECKAKDLHAAIEEAWARKQEEGMEARDVNCTVCNRPDCEPAAHAAWTEFDAERGIWIERTSEEFFGDAISSLTKLLAVATCPECDGTQLSEDGTICFDCQASDYLEEAR